MLMSTIAVKTDCKFLNERNLRLRMTLYLQARRNRVHIKLEYNFDYNIPSNLNHNWTWTWKACNTTSTSMSTVTPDIQNLIIMTMLKLTGIISMKPPRISTASHMLSLVENGTSIRGQNLKQTLDIYHFSAKKKLCGGDTQRICIW